VLFRGILLCLWCARLPQPRLEGRSALLVHLDISMVLTAAYMCYSTISLRIPLPEVTKVPRITGWDLLRNGTSVGAVCSNNYNVSGLAFTDNALWVLVDV